MAGNDDEMFMTRSLNVTPKITEQHLIARPLCDSRATCFTDLYALFQRQLHENHITIVVHRNHNIIIACFSASVPSQHHGAI